MCDTFTCLVIRKTAGFVLATVSGLSQPILPLTAGYFFPSLKFDVTDNI